MLSYIILASKNVLFPVDKNEWVSIQPNHNLLYLCVINSWQILDALAEQANNVNVKIACFGR